MMATDTSVLIVDDNAVNRKLASLVLRNAGIPSEEASSGEEALQMLTKSSFKCVLLDVNMPGLTGEEVCQKIRADSGLKHLRVIAYTAHAFADERQRIIQSGFDGLITKPVSKDGLLAAIQGT
jgi:CheY-like chemotaxis protein